MNSKMKIYANVCIAIIATFLMNVSVSLAGDGGCEIGHFEGHVGNALHELWEWTVIFEPQPFHTERAAIEARDVHLELRQVLLVLPSLPRRNPDVVVLQSRLHSQLLA